MIMRTSEIKRNTSETKINLKINLDGSGVTKSDSGLPFLDHMIDQIGKHGLIDIDLKAEGDLHIDDHHTIEDIGICFGEALKEAIGEKRGIRRYGFSYIPLDEALSRVVLDFSGRPGLFLDVKYAKDTVGNIDVDLFEHFFQSICNHGFLTLHITNFSGDNTHHQVETIFKAFGKALRMAIEVDTKSGENIPSTKGSL
tara:strand:+ start:2630 stop:3223 length:594 start_codon:yes stop_codon:yes gene_type:complete